MKLLNVNLVMIVFIYKLKKSRVNIILLLFYKTIYDVEKVLHIKTCLQNFNCTYRYLK